MLLSRNRLFDRQEPTRDAQLIIIFCEGIVTEPQYFKFFSSIRSNIALEIVAPDSSDNNSPSGLYQAAIDKIIPENENLAPKYLIGEGDQVWFVIDTDSWGEHINEIYEKCGKHGNWFIAQSNPCFEVWQYYHFFDSVPTDQNLDKSGNWKSHLNKSIPGGFDKRKHPKFVWKAIENSKANYSEANMRPELFSTNVFRLVETFYHLIEDEINREPNNFNQKQPI